ncbi:hypothetical protein L873DRAFT_1901007 [Choiromyces venosus 120613-1]|uniref:Uncharacterized protein n=1 Tax=Choiromyces venosus 120613-1 TaxID=1336337 RepID=A0A3N4K320_9PEZI|nr:hypothetical protein L873DRAFT_1901007 [Choiromyces venosus 120613-1]
MFNVRIRDLGAFIRPYHQAYSYHYVVHNRIFKISPHRQHSRNRANSTKEATAVDDTAGRESSKEPPLTTSQRLTLLEKETREIPKRVGALLFATYGTKFWSDSIIETKIGKQVAAGHARLKRRIDDVEMKLERRNDEAEMKLEKKFLELEGVCPHSAEARDRQGSLNQAAEREGVTCFFLLPVEQYGRTV